MNDDHRLTRRSALLGTGMAAAGLIGNRRNIAAFPATPQATPISRVPLWQTAWQRGIVYGTSAATWQLEDTDYAQLAASEAAMTHEEIEAIAAAFGGQP